MKIPPLFYLTLFLLHSPAWAREIHVAPTGHDQALGSKDQPLLSIQKAASLAEAGDICIIHGGEYHESIRPVKDGEQDKYIVFKAAPGEKVVIWGTQKLENWRQEPIGLVSAPLPFSLDTKNQVFMNKLPLTEARWPNGEAFNFKASMASIQRKVSNPHQIHCKEFPNTWSEADLKGAIVWVMADKKWSAWTSIADQFDPRKKLLSLQHPAGFEVGSWITESHNPLRGGNFRLIGAKALIDQPGEWIYDSQEKRLYLMPPKDVKALDQLNIHAQKNKYGFDLHQKTYIQIKGLELRGCGINLNEASYCHLERCNIQYFFQAKGNVKVNRIDGQPGLVITGRKNVVRDCEIAYSAGNGVMCGGQSNQIVNNYIHHTDFMGSYDACISLSGMDHLISNNTIAYSGRDCLLYSGTGHHIQYNDVSFPAQVAHDSGALYCAGSDGGNTNIHHNWIHDNPGSHLNIGMYVDNYMSNYLIHHNVIWRCGSSMRLNRPTHNIIVYHNSMDVDLLSNWGPWAGQQTQGGTAVFNNSFIKTLEVMPEVFTASNLKDRTFDSTLLQPIYSANSIDKGIALKGVTEAFTVGKAPDIGAYEKGRTSWKAGHDFNHSPQTIAIEDLSPLRNLVKNASFEHESFLPKSDRSDEILYWTRTFLKKSRCEKHEGFNFPPANKRNSIHGYSLTLQGNESDGVEQKCEHLIPNSTYIARAYVRLEDAKECNLTITSNGISAKALASNVKLNSDQVWRLLIVTFRTSTDNTSVTLGITKLGSGKAYVDNTGLLLDIQDFMNRSSAL